MLTVLDTSITDNDAKGSGGGIHSEGNGAELNIYSSTLKGNTAKFSGGAIINDGPLTVQDTSIIDNSANGGGGIHTEGMTSITNSTFHANRAESNNGGGFFNQSGTANIQFSTFTENTADNSGGGIHQKGGTITLGSSVLSNNTATRHGGHDIENVSISTGYNIISSTDYGSFSPHMDDITGVDPQLLPLANNGGPTETHALSPTSPAVDAGATTTVASDQRGFLRDANPDSGAFELNATTTASNPPVITPSVTTTTYIENTGLIIDNGMTVSDTDSPDFDTGTFTVTSTGFSETDDLIYITPTGTGAGEIDLTGLSVLYEGNPIGTWSGGNGSSPLVVSLIAAPTQPAINALAQSIAFAITSEDPDTTARTLSFQMNDGDGSASNTVDITIEIAPVNDAPEGTDNTLNTNEDTPLPLEVADFGFSDPLESDSFAQLVITTPPANGTLSLASVPVSAGQQISISAIANGLLVFTPLADDSNVGYAEFDFQVVDDGNTLNGGINQDPTPDTITIDVLSISDEPCGADNSISIDEDTPYVLNVPDFGFSDTADNDNFTGITLTKLPTRGSLLLAGGPVTLNQTITTTDISNGDLSFVPAVNQSGVAHDHFDFRVNDSGTTANGGINQDQIANRITFDVDSISEAPAGTDNILTTNEDTPVTIRVADFGFSDPNDGDAFASLVVTTLPAKGTLSLSGSPVSASQQISITDIASGQLTFAPVTDDNGASYVDFGFQVIDNGSTAVSYTHLTLPTIYSV